MEKKVRFLLYVIFLSGTFILALRFQAVESVWAGPDHQTVPSATVEASPSPSVTLTETVIATATTVFTETVESTDLPSVTSTATTTLDLTDAASEVTLYPSITPEAPGRAAARGRIGFIVVIAALVLLAGVIAFILLRRRREEEDDYY